MGATMSKKLSFLIGRLALVFAISAVLIVPAMAIPTNAGRPATKNAELRKATPTIAPVAAPVTVRATSASTRVYITRTGSKYHRSGCRYLRQSKIAKTLKWVKAHHYGACKICRPPTR